MNLNFIHLSGTYKELHEYLVKIFTSKNQNIEFCDSLIWKSKLRRKYTKILWVIVTFYLIVFAFYKYVLYNVLKVTFYSEFGKCSVLFPSDFPII